jgi:hypothetical protein
VPSCTFPGERVVSKLALEIAEDQIVAIRAVVDPEKLQHVRRRHDQTLT